MCQSLLHVISMIVLVTLGFTLYDCRIFWALVNIPIGGYNINPFHVYMLFIIVSLARLS